MTEDLPSHYETDPAKIIKAAREQLGLELNPARCKMTLLEMVSSSLSPVH
jgi:hypothetical protein